MIDFLDTIGGWALIVALLAAFLWLPLMMVGAPLLWTTVIGRISISALLLCYCSGWLCVYGPRVLKRIRR